MDSFFPGHGEKSQEILGIVKIMKGDTVVGWLYRTQDGKFYVQSMPNMPARDQHAAGIRPVQYDPSYAGRFFNKQIPERYSGLFEIHRWPWSDLKLSRCGASDIQSSRNSH